MNRQIPRVLATLTALLATSAAHALSISALPEMQNVFVTDGQVTVDIVMDFEEQSIGGGIVLDFGGPIAFQSFAPSAFFRTLDTAADDTDFTGFGTNNKPADAEFEIHLGSFNGFGGRQTLGTLTFALLDLGIGSVDVGLSPDTFYGGFFDLQANPQQVTLNSAQISSLPLPASAWLFATGMGIAGLRRRRRGR